MNWRQMGSNLKYVRYVYCTVAEFAIKKEIINYMETNCCAICANLLKITLKKLRNTSGTSGSCAKSI